MIVVYEGACGIYLCPSAHWLEGKTEKKMIAKVGDGKVLGDNGLLKEAARGATVTAETEVKAMYLSLANYRKVIFSFELSQMFDNIRFMKDLPVIKSFSYER